MQRFVNITKFRKILLNGPPQSHDDGNEMIRIWFVVFLILKVELKDDQNFLVNYLNVLEQFG